MERTINYLTEKMGQFLRRGDPVLICFSDDQPDSLGTLFREAALRCGARPVIWGPDYRWKTLLRQTFHSRAGTVIAPPLVILGLTKLAKAMSTPLYIRNVLTAGYSCTDWMIDGIRAGLDCRSWGCFDVFHESVVAGFSCGTNRGVHINADEFDVEIRDDRGAPLPDGMLGNVVLRSKRDGSCVFTSDLGRIDTIPCGCGSNACKLTDLGPGPRTDPELVALHNSINRWSSVLDCRVSRGASGLEIEVVVFPGEKLPKLPSCAKLIVRPWAPDQDAPFFAKAAKGNIF